MNFLAPRSSCSASSSSPSRSRLIPLGPAPPSALRGPVHEPRPARQPRAAPPVVAPPPAAGPLPRRDRRAAHRPRPPDDGRRQVPREDATVDPGHGRLGFDDARPTSSPTRLDAAKERGPVVHRPAAGGIRVGIVAVRVEPRHARRADRPTGRQLKDAIDGLTARDGTAMGDALMQVLDIAEKIQKDDGAATNPGASPSPVAPAPDAAASTPPDASGHTAHADDGRPRPAARRRASSCPTGRNSVGEAEPLDGSRASRDARRPDLHDRARHGRRPVEVPDDDGPARHARRPARHARPSPRSPRSRAGRPSMRRPRPTSRRSTTTSSRASATPPRPRKSPRPSRPPPSSVSSPAPALPASGSAGCRDGLPTRPRSRRSLSTR